MPNTSNTHTYISHTEINRVQSLIFSLFLPFANTFTCPTIVPATLLCGPNWTTNDSFLNDSVNPVFSLEGSLD